MRKLTLALDDIQVASFETEAEARAAGTVYGADQTQPDSTFNPCTGSKCTYPVYLCRPAIEENEGEKKRKR